MPDAAALKDSPPLPERNLTSLGEPIRLGSVEFTPLSVERETVTLVHTIDPEERRQARGQSLILRVRLKNLSDNRTFAPLEPASVRENLAIRNETFVESDRGKVGMYPLVLQSEWSLADQSFPKLPPGESAETLIATAPIDDTTLGEQMAWRIRLRVSPHQTDIVGVTFSRDEIATR
jgi:hypothetical protein